MSEKPILFSGEMVRAILEGRKTQTRRVIKPQPNITMLGDIEFPWATFFRSGQVHTWDRDGVGGQNWNANEYPDENKFSEALTRTKYENPCPYGQPGDILWVRETGWRYNGNYYFAADYLTGTKNLVKEAKIFPSIHMPREAARIFLRVKAVRVEKVQDISEKDADAEGFGGNCPYDAFPEHKGSPGWYDGSISIPECFGELWDSIYAKRGYGWEVNPWVFVIEFERMDANA